MKKNNAPEQISSYLKWLRRGGPSNPWSLLFTADQKEEFEEAVSFAEKSGLVPLDLNDYFAERPDDGDIPLRDCFLDSDLCIKDVLEPIEKKKRLAIRAKANRLEKAVTEKTVLLVRYNDFYLQNRTVYEIVRSTIKDGYLFRGAPSRLPVLALIYCETKESLRDFCPYGMHAVTFEQEP